jgi:AraC-like DNA-binding protein
MPELKTLSLPTPAPTVTRHVKSYFNFQTATRYVHDYHILGLRVSGTGYYKLGPERLPDEPPLAAFLPAGDDDTCGIVGDVESWWTAFQWPGAKIIRDGTHHLELRFDKTFTVRFARWKKVDIAALTRMVEMYRSLQAALEHPHGTGVIEARSILMSLFVFYAELPDDASTGHRALSRFMNLLRETACADVAIEELAERAGISPDHARDLFRRRMGVAPIEYRTSLRMTHARDLLANSVLNVKEVAKKCGYPDAQYFSRVFKAHFGISPVEIIRQYRLER